MMPVLSIFFVTLCLLDHSCTYFWGCSIFISFFKCSAQNGWSFSPNVLHDKTLFILPNKCLRMFASFC